MAYAVLADLKQRLGSQTTPPGLYEQLTDRLSATTADDAVGQALLDDAQATVDQKLAGRYAVPIDTTGDATLAAWLKNASLVIATWNGWSRHPIRSRLKENVEADYKAVMKTLEAIAAGIEELPAASVLPPHGSTLSGPRPRRRANWSQRCRAAHCSNATSCWGRPTRCSCPSRPAHGPIGRWPTRSSASATIRSMALAPRRGRFT
jgi:phage gp36-like protein